jgi:hypothetical protein
MLVGATWCSANYIGYTWIPIYEETLAEKQTPQSFTTNAVVMAIMVRIVLMLL